MVQGEPPDLVPMVGAAAVGRDRSGGRAYLVMALAAGAVLLYEIAITRLLSVVLWYHFAFLSVSLAMLGLGVPGVWYALRPPRDSSLGPVLAAAGAAIPASIVWIVHPVGPPGTSRGVTILAFALAILIPFLLLGGAVCRLLIAARGRRIGRMYAADLAGATLGACLVVPLLDAIPTPKLLAAIGFLPLLAAFLADRRRRFVPCVLAAAVAVTLYWGEPYRLRYNKSYGESGLGVLYEKWTPVARLTVFPGIMWSRDAGVKFGWGLGSRFRGGAIDQLWVDQDGSAGTPITRFAGDLGQLDHLFYDVTSVAFQLRPPRTVCIVGAGGGRDILTALEAGARNVDAVELNRHMIDVVSDVFGDYSSDPYHLPGVVAVASEGRSFLTRTKRRYGLIQIALIDSWAATTAGAYALSENYLYTVEAFRLFLARLTDTGMVSVSRWTSGRHQLEGARLALLARQALASAGLEEPLGHLAVVRGGQVATALLSVEPFSGTLLARLDAVAKERGFVRLWPPVPGSPEPLVAHVLTAGPGALTRMGFHLAPPTDETPFFFQNVRALSRVDRALLDRFSVNERAAVLPRFLVLAISVLTLALFFSPFLLAGRIERGQGFWRGSGYFLAIGLGFMLIEIPLLQKFILYVGHPSYATPVVLGTLLCGSGVGSFVAGAVSPATLSRWRLAVPGAAALECWALPAVFASTLGWSFAARVGVSLGLVAPLGFVLGFAFPTGMIRFGDTNRAWYWALNGAASVLANVAALALAAYVGLTHVIWAGVACYLAACLALPVTDPIEPLGGASARRRPRSEQRPRRESLGRGVDLEDTASHDRAAVVDFAGTFARTRLASRAMRWSSPSARSRRRGMAWLRSGLSYSESQ